jgi:hypothetical protein
MMVVSAAASMQQAQQKNRQAKGLARNAIDQTAKRQAALLERDDVMSGRIKKKSDQQRMAVARKTAEEAGSRIAMAAGQGTISDTGTAARGIADTWVRGEGLQEVIGENFVSDTTDLRMQTEAGLDESQARLENILNQAQGMTQSMLLAGLMGGAQGAPAGTGVNTGLGIDP